jgi:hypothetical protein
MSDYQDTVRMYRCQGCGKWSHAKKQPMKHVRWVREGDPEFDPSKGAGGAYDHMTGFSELDGHGIECGPFISYVAMPGR